MIIIRELIGTRAENLREAFEHGVAMEIPTAVPMLAEPLIEVMADLEGKFGQAGRPSTDSSIQCLFSVVVTPREF